MLIKDSIITKASFAGLELPRLLNEVKYSIYGGSSLFEPRNRNLGCK